MKYKLNETYMNLNFGKNKKRPSLLLDNDVVIIPFTCFCLEKQLAKDVEWKSIESFTVIQYEADYLKEQREIEQECYITKFKETYYQDVLKLLGVYSQYSSVFLESSCIRVLKIYDRNVEYFLPTDITDISYEGVLSLKDTIHSMKVDIECEQIRIAEESELLTKQRAAKEKLLQMMTKEELEVLGIK